MPLLEPQTVALIASPSGTALIQQSNSEANLLTCGSVFTDINQMSVEEKESIDFQY